MTKNVFYEVHVQNELLKAVKVETQNTNLKIYAGDQVVKLKNEADMIAAESSQGGRVFRRVT